MALHAPAVRCSQLSPLFVSTGPPAGRYGHAHCEFLLLSVECVRAVCCVCVVGVCECVCVCVCVCLCVCVCVCV